MKFVLNLLKSDPRRALDDEIFKQTYDRPTAIEKDIGVDADILVIDAVK